MRGPLAFRLALGSWLVAGLGSSLPPSGAVTTSFGSSTEIMRVMQSQTACLSNEGAQRIYTRLAF